MPIKCSVFIATSLDGFIARPDGRIDWLDAANAKVPPGEDFGYGAFVATVDAIVMGRQTFESVQAFEPWPYGSLPVIVLSRRQRTLPPGLPATVTWTDTSPIELMVQLAEQGYQHLYIDGGVTIQRFLVANLIADLIITQIPVLLGVGRPLFGPLPQDLSLELIATRGYACGFVQSHYRVLYPPA
ncbi:dihydrofolate reductase family protein [Trichothermofontia sp.]